MDVRPPAFPGRKRGVWRGGTPTARLVHHAEILSLKGDSYRLRDKDLGAPNRAKSADFA